jgi:hypothetical protein
LTFVVAKVGAHALLGLTARRRIAPKGGGQEPAVVEVDRKRDVDLARADRLIEERLTTI